MFELFPKVQFIVSSHSPFVAMGLADKAKDRTVLFDLDKNGIATDVETNELYEEVYNTMIGENERYKELYDTLKANQSNSCFLVVEDTYDEIYKIAWLKINNIEFDKDNLEEKFKKNSYFCILNGNTSEGVAGLMNARNVEIFNDKKIIGLFDYDKEGSEKFYNLKNGFEDNDIRGMLEKGFYKQKTTHSCMYALLLPVPQRLHKLICSNGDWNSDSKFFNCVEVETLLSESYLSQHNGYEKAKLLNFEYYKAKDKKKNTIWKELIDAPKETFEDFEELFNTTNELFEFNK